MSNTPSIPAPADFFYALGDKSIDYALAAAKNEDEDEGFYDDAATMFYKVADLISAGKIGSAAVVISNMCDEMKDEIPDEIYDAIMV